MLAMQYSYTFPADYEMQRIDDRVAAKGLLFDNLPNMAFKVFLAARKGANGSQGNIYAPFYVWKSSEGMNSFLTDDKFQGVVQSFGWPLVQTWSVLNTEISPSLRKATFAVRHTTRIDAYAPLSALKSRAHDEVKLAIEDGAVAGLSAFEPTTWTQIKFTLWPQPIEIEASPSAQCYSVLHVSAPDASPLNGRT
jgi:Domain of unknown function (DUF4865)